MHVSIIGKGFVGSAISKYLDFKLISYDCLNSQIFNLCQSDTWISLPKNTDVVVLAAGKISNNTFELKEVNVNPIIELCTFFKKCRIKKLIVLSTGAVYGSYDIETSSSNICVPESNYGKSKLEAENLILEHWESKLNILRLFFPYGPKQKLPRLMPSLIKKIMEGSPIQINDDGGPFISLTHVEDLAKVIVEDFILTENKQIISNIASPFKVNIRDLSNELSKHIGKQPLFEKTKIKSSNCTSVPYNFSWKKSGNFKDLFGEI
ncbi:MAG: SDR family oxidoreductase [Alphaproteobacteria bacterium]